MLFRSEGLFLSQLSERIKKLLTQFLTGVGVKFASNWYFFNAAQKPSSVGN